MKASNQSDPESIARTVLEIADEIERTEMAIKKELLKTARNGDVQRIEEIVKRWISEPVSNVLSDDEEKKEQ